MLVMAGELVLKLEPFLLQAMEQIFVGVAAMLLFVDQRVERSVFGCQFLDLSLFHRCRFPSSVVETVGQ